MPETTSPGANHVCNAKCLHSLNLNEAGVHTCTGLCKHYTGQPENNEARTFFDKDLHVTKAQAANEVYLSHKSARNSIYIGFIGVFIAAALEDIVLGGVVAVAATVLLGFIYIRVVRHMDYLNSKYDLGYKKFNIKDIKINMDDPGAKK